MPAITKSSRLTAYEWTCDLDRIAIPLIAKHGVTEAYLIAAEQLEGRSPCGRRLEEFGGNLGSGGRNLASGRFEGSTRVTKC